MTSKQLTPLAINGTSPALFIVPAAGTTPFSLIHLARSLQNKHPVYSFEAPGLNYKNAPYDTVEEIASAYLDEIRTVQATGPYLLGGYCGGAFIALEMARQLESLSEQVARLIILESIAPERVDTNSSADNIHSIQDSAAMEQAMKIVFRQITGQLARLPEEYAEQFKKSCYHLLHLLSQYRASGVISPIALIRTQTHSANLFEGWEALTSADFTEHIITGDTQSMLAPPIVTVLSEILTQVLGDL